MDYLQWQGSRDVGPTIAALNDHVSEIVEREYGWLENKLKGASKQDRTLIRQMLHRVVKKVLHEPTRTLHKKGRDGRGQVYAETMRTLFGLRDKDN
jgi:glutamyl-tRNA reductase